MTHCDVLAGASGLVGRALAAELAADPGCIELNLLLRRPDPGLEALPHARRIAWDGAALPPLPAADRALCALGTTIRAAGSRQAFRRVDFDAVVGFARAARAAGARRFAVISALGADPASGVFYNRVKGEAEQAVRQLGFDVLVIARPSLLLGDRGALGQPRRAGEALAQRVLPSFAALLPRRLRPIEAGVVASAIVRLLDEAPPGVHVVESDRLQQQGRA